MYTILEHMSDIKLRINYISSEDFIRSLISGYRYLLIEEVQVKCPERYIISYTYNENNDMQKLGVNLLNKLIYIFDQDHAIPVSVDILNEDKQVKINIEFCPFEDQANLINIPKAATFSGNQTVEGVLDIVIDV